MFPVIFAVPIFGQQRRAMLQAINLECMRGQRRLFRDLSFDVADGELLWVAGANGSGKTSLLRIVCTLLRAESGEVRWDGTDIRVLGEAFLADLVYIGHAPAVKDDLTALENLGFSLAQHGLATSADEQADALGRFGLAGREDLPARSLSQGQRRRVGLARLLFGASRRLWILDEPLAALDAKAVDLVREQIGIHLERGGVVLLTSHQEIDFDGLRVRHLQLDA
jgi:heme exporter protein A